MQSYLWKSLKHISHVTQSLEHISHVTQSRESVLDNFAMYIVSNCHLSTRVNHASSDGHMVLILRVLQVFLGETYVCELIVLNVNWSKIKLIENQHCMVAAMGLK